jgi:uncharacterized protein (TIGR03382 family)
LLHILNVRPPLFGAQCMWVFGAERRTEASMKIWLKMMTVGMALCAWASPALAGGYCSDTQACKSSNETCQGNYCVPTAKLCTGDSACQTWEKCDFTCPSGIGGGGSTSTGGGTVSSDAISASDGFSSGSADAGSSGSGSSDASSGPSSSDASGVPYQPDASEMPYPDADFNPNDGGPWVPPQSNCPKSPGVCVAVPSKVPAQAGCDTLCNVLVPCHLSFGSGQSSGGSSGGSGGGTTPSTDAGSTDPSYPDAASNPSEPDAMIPSYDAGSVDVTPGPEEMAQCVAICSIWVLDQVAAPELASLEQCVAVQFGCDAVEKTCGASAKAFMKAAEANDAWSLGMGGSMTSGGSETGGTKDGDASPVFDNADASTGGTDDSGSGAPQQIGDTVGGDAGSTAGQDSAAPKSGCSAGTTSHGSAGLAILALLGSALILRRRRNA